MSSRITKTNVYKIFEVVNLTAKERGFPSYDLHVWAPGDGSIRYQLFCAKNGTERSLVCSTREMYNALYVLLNALERIP